MRSTLIAATLLSMSVASCGETVEPVPVAAIELTPGDATLGSLGQTTRIIAVALDASGNEIPGRRLAWTSSNPSVATVDDSAVVRAVGNGEALITASAGGASESVEVVVDQAVARIAVSPFESLLTSIGDTVQLTAVAYDALDNPIAGQGVTWLWADSGAVRITAQGAMIALKNGLVTFGAEAEGAYGVGLATVEQRVASLAFTAQPMTTQKNVAIPAVTVALRDARGNLAVNASNTVTLALAPHLSGAAMSGTTAVAAAGGVATFSGLSVDQSGVGYTVSAAAGEIPFATSNPFEIMDVAARIDSVVLSTSQVKRGASTEYKVWITNGAGRNLVGAGTQGLILQPGIQHGAGGSVTVGCSPTLGVVPHGTCRLDRSLSVGNDVTLGAFTARIVLFEGTTTLAHTDVPVTIVP